MQNLIELHNVSKIYRGAVDAQVLFNINLMFAQGTLNSIVGESGSGKSTLLNILGTLDRPTDGEVIINGYRISTLDKNGLATLRNQAIGFVFQFHYLLPEFTALENALIPYQIGGKKVTGETLKRADEIFEMLGIAKVKNNPAMKMSGGQQQRTAIARALMNNPRIILADEPTGNLDTENTKNIYQIFREINKNFGTTFVIVTHDRSIAQQTDRIIEMCDGKICSG